MTNAINHIEATIMYIRACGPVTKEQIAKEIETHVAAANAANADMLAQSAIDHGKETGWIEEYDEESYVIA